MGGLAQRLYDGYLRLKDAGGLERVLRLRRGRDGQCRFRLLCGSKAHLSIQRSRSGEMNGEANSLGLWGGRGDGLISWIEV